MAANGVAAPAATGDATTPATVGDVVLTIAAALGQFFRPDLVHLSLAPIAAKHGVSLPSAAQLAGKPAALTAGGEGGIKKKGKKKGKEEGEKVHARTGKLSIYSMFVTRLANHAAHYGNNPFFKGQAEKRPLQMAGLCWHNLTAEQKEALKVAYTPIMEAFNSSVDEGGPKEDVVHRIEAYEKAHPQASLNHILRLKLKDSERTEPPAKKTPGSKGVKPEPAAGGATGPVAAPAMVPRPVAAAAAAVPLASPAGGKRKAAADEDGDADGEGAGGSHKKKRKHKDQQEAAAVPAAAPAAVTGDGAAEKKKKKKKKHVEESD